MFAYVKFSAQQNVLHPNKPLKVSNVKCNLRNFILQYSYILVICSPCIRAAKKVN